MFVLTALASAIVTAVAAGPVREWPFVVSNEGRFKVQMPGPVDESVETISTDLSSLDQHTFTCSTGHALWRVSYVDLPKEVLRGQSPESILIAGQSGARTMKGMQVFSEPSPKFWGAHSRRFRTVAPNGPVVSHLLVFKSSRLFHLMVVSPPDRFRRVGTRSFFDSFTLD